MRKKTTKKAEKKRHARRKPVRNRAAAKPVTPPVARGTKLDKAVRAFVGEAQGNKTAACRKAGYAETTAEHQATRVLGTPKAQTAIKAILDAHGLTDEALVAKHGELLNAHAVEFYKGKRVDKDQVIDAAVQTAALELAYKVKGHLKQYIVVEQVVEVMVDAVLPLILEYVPKDKHAECADAILKRVADAARN